VETPYQIAANLIINELLPRLSRHKIRIEDSPVPGTVIAALSIYKHEGKIDTHTIRRILDRFFQ
jgi:Asp-tRNA(Asn)/Glu-tRNA(Gln) amidotransferase B subunit